MQRNVLLTFLVLSGCFGADADSAKDRSATTLAATGTSKAVTYYRDVKPIIDEKCTQCHTKGGGGHFSLESYNAVKPLAASIRAAVNSGMMPPWRASGPLDQYLGDRRLTDEQKSILIGWIDQGAPEGRANEEPSKRPPQKRGLNRVDETLRIGRYTPKDGDDYRCFPLEFSADHTRYITGLSIEPGDKELVHHAIVYLVQPDRVASVRNSDKADPEPGYRCMGGPGAWLTSYEPGGFGEENPGGVGFEFRPGAMLVLQMHYNTLRKKGTDTSEVQLTLEDRVERVGKVSLLMNPMWPARSMPIPADDEDVVHKWQGRPAGFAADQTYDLFWADLHMHTRGTSAKMGIIRASNGRRENLLDIPEWAFEWQETYLLKQPVRLYPNDQFYVECHWDNTAKNQPIVNGERQPPRNMNWGERTTDEMCLGNVLSTPVRDAEPPPEEGEYEEGDSDEGKYEDEGEYEEEDDDSWWW